MRVLVTDYVFAGFDREREILATVGAELELLQCRSVEELIPHLAEADGLLNTYLPGIGARVFDHAPKLKAVVRYGIGVDTIDIPEATRRGILVANVPDYCVREVADHALAHFLCLARKIALADRRAKAGEWSLAYLKPMPPVHDMTARILGFGRIDRAIALRLRPMVQTIVFCDPCVPAGSDGCHRVTFDELLAVSDALFVQCPATPDTRALFNREAFAKMRRRPWFINCARGDVVETDALIWALESGQIAGAGLDVVEDEKGLMAHPEHPLRRMENVSLTPHSAWYSEAAIPNLQRRAAEAMAQALSGQRPDSLLNPEVWERRRL